jgi:Zn-dependent metalloprotease
VGPDAQFPAFAGATVQAAESLFGRGSPEAAAVGGAWSQVGVI